MLYRSLFYILVGLIALLFTLLVAVMAVCCNEMKKGSIRDKKYAKIKHKYRKQVEKDHKEYLKLNKKYEKASTKLNYI